MAYSPNPLLQSASVLSEPFTDVENITPAIATKRRASSTSRKNSSQFAQVFHPSLSSMNKNKKKVPKSGKNKISKPGQNVTLSAISAMFQPRPFFIPGTPAGLITAGVPFSGHKAKAFATTSTTTAFAMHPMVPLCQFQWSASHSAEHHPHKTHVFKVLVTFKKKPPAVYS